MVRAGILLNALLSAVVTTAVLVLAPDHYICA